MPQLYPFVKTGRFVLKNLLSFVCLLITNHLFAQPAISSFTPASGPVGTPVTITGTNFSTTPANNSVFFGAVKAVVTTASSTTLTVNVPVSATFEPITVTANGLTGYSAQPFMVTFPTNELTYKTFAGRFTFTTKDAPQKAALGDLDGDGKPEIVVASNSGSALQVFKNTSTPVGYIFTQAFVSGIQYGASDCTLGDIDGDGKLDIVVTARLNGQAHVFRNTTQNGTISFDTPSDEATDGLPTAAAIKDFDGDGRQDIITANGYHTISIIRNIGNPGIIFLSYKKDINSGLTPTGIAVADFDRDGKPDFATPNAGQYNFTVFRNTSTTGNITFATTNITTPGSGADICTGDFDGDGKSDIAVTNENGNIVSIFKNTSTATGVISFSPNVDFSGSYPNGIIAADLNGDGKTDFAATEYKSHYVDVYMNSSTGGTLQFIKAYYDCGNGPASVSIGDIDGDGRADIVTSNERDNNFSVLRNSATPEITSFTPTSGGAGTTVTISGNNFSGATAVTIGGIAVTSFTVVSSTTITAVIAAGSKGIVSVTTPYGTAALDGFTLPVPAAPTITAIGSPVACRGDNVILTSSATANNQWYRYGSPVGGATAQTYVVNIGGEYAASVSDNGVTSALSAPIVVILNNVPVKPVITRKGAELVSSSSSGNQWYKDGVAIQGATNVSIKPVDEGNYTVKVTIDGCTSLESDIFPYTHTVTGVINIDNTHYIKLNPNPVKDRVLLEFNIEGINAVTIQVIDINGRICKTFTSQVSGNQVSLSSLNNGVYFVKIYTRNQQQQYMMQLIKQ